MKRLVPYLLSLILGLCFGACVNSSGYDDKVTSFTQITASHTYSLIDSDTVFNSDSNLIFADSVSLLMPTLIDNHDIHDLQDTILKLAFDTTGVDHVTIVHDFLKREAEENEFKVEIIPSIPNVYHADGFVCVKGNVVNLSPGLLVYCVTNESMQPRSAHGMTVKRYVNYLTDTGKIISLSDLFTPKGLEALPAIIARRAADEATVFGPTEVESLPVNGNYYISSDGEIVFAYQPYEVASFAQGFINVPFYPYELASLLTPMGIKLFKLQDLSK